MFSKRLTTLTEHIYIFNIWYTYLYCQLIFLRCEGGCSAEKKLLKQRFDCFTVYSMHIYMIKFECNISHKCIHVPWKTEYFYFLNLISSFYCHRQIFAYFNRFSRVYRHSRRWFMVCSNLHLIPLILKFIYSARSMLS